MFNRQVFGERVKTLRIACGLSQEELGKIIGLTKSSFSNMESGYRATSIEVLCALAEYFDCSLDYLTGRTDNPNSHKW